MIINISAEEKIIVAGGRFSSGELYFGYAVCLGVIGVLFGEMHGENLERNLCALELANNKWRDRYGFANMTTGMNGQCYVVEFYERPNSLWTGYKGDCVCLST